MAEALINEEQGLESTTVKIYRTATVVKGGRRFSFGALVVVGDRKGSVGIGYGKAPGVPAAIEKAQKDARKSLRKITLLEGTLPHSITAKFGASLVKLVPAAPGTGVIAGATVRAVLELVGVRDCLTKSYGSNNHKNLLKATIEGLCSLRSKQEIMDLRGVDTGPTDVEQRLESGLRFAPAAPTSAPAEAPKSTFKRGRSRPQGRGRDNRRQSGPPAAAATGQPPAPKAIEQQPSASPVPPAGPDKPK